ncbi:MAG: hypothetical protein MRK00_16300 [Nitrosomonas sp.]|nr:hypothetical protein [Nitrosomonas sp.]
MKIGRCPNCHSHIQLEAVMQDEAIGKLATMLASMEADLARPLISYLGLFRPEKRDLANDRALRLAQEVIDLTSDKQNLAAALTQTVELIRSKGGGPLKNHNYLKRVIDGMEKTPKTQVIIGTTGGGKNIGKTEQAYIDLEKMKQ